VAAARAAGASTRPVVACLMADQVEPPLVVGRERVPTYTFPENAARALAAAAAYAAWREQPAGLFWGFDDVQSGEARAIVERALAERGDGWLTTEETRGVLGAFRLPLAGGTIVRSADDAAAAAAALGYPVVA
jgi:acyl-CoA synthetase (NDP forming)